MTRKVYNMLRGAGSVLEILPPPRRNRVGEGLLQRSDADALRGDWEKVGQDMKAAIDKTAKGLSDHAASK